VRLALYLTLALPAAAAAQAPTIVLLPDDTPADVREAIVVELRLSGHVVIVASADGVDEHAARALHAHSNAAATLLLREVAEATEVVLTYPERVVHDRLEGSLAHAAPRAIALTISAILERPPPVEPPPVVVDVEDAIAGVVPEPEVPDLLAEPAQPIAEREPIVEPPRTFPREERVAIELLGGTLGAASLGTAGALLADAATSDDFPAWAVGLTIGGTIGMSVGVLISGLLSGANGDPWWTLIAGVAGGLIAGALLSIGAATDHSPMDGADTAFTFIGTALAITLPPLFSVLAFELTIPE
jgi:hypothetical protein